MRSGARAARRNELRDHVSSDPEPPTTFRIASVSPRFRSRLARTRKAEKSITETLGPGRPGPESTSELNLIGVGEWDASESLRRPADRLSHFRQVNDDIGESAEQEAALFICECSSQECFTTLESVA